MSGPAPYDLESSLNRVIGFIQNCDHKASIVLATNGIVLSLVIGLLASLHPEISEVFARSMSPLEIMWTALIIVGFILSLIGLALLIWVLYPTLSATPYSDQNDPERASLIYFGTIANYSHQDFREAYLDSSDEEVRDDFLSQIHINSNIASAKFRKYRTGVLFTGAGILLLLIGAPITLAF